MNNEKIKQYLPRVFLVLFFLTVSIYINFFSSPEELISLIGVSNAYLLMFFLAFIGGMTTFNGIPYHLVLITLANGGLNPWLLGTLTAFGVMFGDSTSYYLGYQGSNLIPKSLCKIFELIKNFGLKYPKLMPMLLFLYGSISPFSNDFITISMGLSRYPFFKVMIPLGLGNLVFNVSLAYFATQAYDLLKGILF